jgi:hypothetical protein
VATEVTLPPAGNRPLLKYSDRQSRDRGGRFGSGGGGAAAPDLEAPPRSSADHPTTRIVGGKYTGPSGEAGQPTSDDALPGAKVRWASTWRPHAAQGNNSRCAALAYAMLVTTKPIGLTKPPLKVAELFRRMQDEDGQPLPHYGTTLTAGATVMQDLGLMPNGFTKTGDFDQVKDYLEQQGPVVVQMPWPLTGNATSLHAFVLDGIDPASGKIRVHNGWPFANGKDEAWFDYGVIRSRLSTPDGAAILPMFPFIPE